MTKIKITENEEAPLAMQYNICKVTQLCKNRGILSKCYMACCHHKGGKFINSPNNYNPDLSDEKSKLPYKIILETKPYSSNPVSDHIEWRLCYCPGNSITPFAVWRYDRNDDIYYGGKYYAKIMGAVKAFEDQ